MAKDCGRASEVGPIRFYVMSADIEAHGNTSGCPSCVALASHGIATKVPNDAIRERMRTIIERTVTGKTRMNAYKDRKKEKELELSEVQGMCLWNPGTKVMSRWRFDMRTHLAVTSRKTNTKRTE